MMSESSWLPAPNSNGMYLRYGTTSGDSTDPAVTNNLYSALTFSDKTNESLRYWGNAIQQVFDNLPEALSPGFIEVMREMGKSSTVTEKEAEEIAYDAAEHAITIIQERYDIDEIIEDLQWISQIVMDDIMDYIADLLDTDYDFSSSEENAREDVIEQICDMIDWDYIYDTLEEYSHQPRTMFDKLRDIGMRESDFL